MPLFYFVLILKQKTAAQFDFFPKAKKAACCFSLQKIAAIENRNGCQLYKSWTAIVYKYKFSNIEKKRIKAIKWSEETD